MRLLTGLLVCSFLAGPALAQSKAELAAEDARLRQRLTVLEQRFLTGDPAAQQLMQRVDSMETTVRSLRGEVEQLRFERDRLQSEVKALADDVRIMQQLSDRVRIHLDAVDIVADERTRQQGPRPVQQQGSLQGTLPPSGMPPFGSVSSGQPSAVPQPPSVRQVTIPVQQDFAELSKLPEAGRTKLAEGNFSGAEGDFSRYLDLNPDAPDAAEVRYWLGESHFVRGRYADAADAYIASMRKDARGSKAPDAMVRLGAALRELGKTAEACQTLRSFRSQYPSAGANVRSKAELELSRTSC